MITYSELIKGYNVADIPIAHQHNLEELLKRMNLLRNLWGNPMIVTSGYRSKQHHLRVYSEIASRKKVPFDESKVPMGSRHLVGMAVDIYDPNGELLQWCKDNQDVLEEIGLWCEEKDSEPRVHFQTVPPKSGKRFFYASENIGIDISNIA